MIGQTLSHFEITAKLGEGGMGAVYLARDTSLGREVAIKVLPEAFTSDPERLARFEREAQVLASLNHANIAGIHEVGEAGVEGEALRFLVMELAPGEDLSERLSRGAIPLDEALRFAMQIADALGAAHESGIVHRDLKPANIKITPEGRIKVLDFGLAKAWSGPGGGTELSHSPTLTAQMTQVGTLLGTAAYMSPEQARGEEADRRADVWAFGLILSEMLSGRKTFNEPTVSDTLAAVLKTDPDLSGLPTDRPALQRLVERCLRKDARERLRDMGDVGLELREIAAGSDASDLLVEAGPSTERSDHERPAAAALARSILVGSLIGLLVALGAWWLLPSQSAPVVTEKALIQFSLPAPEGHSYLRGITISPDGTRVAVTVIEHTTGESTIWVRDLSSNEMYKVDGSEGGRRPFWSPDSRKIGFFSYNALRVADLLGTPPRSLTRTDGPLNVRGATWAGDTILYAPTYAGGLVRIPASGGEPEPATILDPDGPIGTQRFPWFLPDGEHFLVYASAGTGMEPGEIHLGRLGSTETRRLVDSHSTAVFAPPDHLIYVKGDVLVTQTLDLDSLEVTGDPVALGPKLPGGLAVSGSRSLGVSAQGTLAYRAEDFSRTRLTLRAADGTEIGTLGDEQTWHYGPTFSPDARSVVVTRYGKETNGGDVWIYDMDRGFGRPILAEPGDEDFPVWSADGDSVFFTTVAGGVTRVLRQNIGGSDQTLLYESAEKPLWGLQSVPDGTGLLAGLDNPTERDLVVLALDGSGDLEEVFATPFDEDSGQVSSDGKWIAYSSNPSGRDEIYVAPFRAEGVAWQVSSDGGGRPRWSSDGSKLFFVATDGWLFETDVTATGSFSTSSPRRLFDARIDPDQGELGYSVAPDGTFVINQRVDDAGAPVAVVIGWERLLDSSP